MYVLWPVRIASASDERFMTLFVIKLKTLWSRQRLPVVLNTATTTAAAAATAPPPTTTTAATTTRTN